MASQSVVWPYNWQARPLSVVFAISGRWCNSRDPAWASTPKRIPVRRESLFSRTSGIGKPTHFWAQFAVKSYGNLPPDPYLSRSLPFYCIISIVISQPHAVYRPFPGPLKSRDETPFWHPADGYCASDNAGGTLPGLTSPHRRNIA
jgi:hypothetical protein